MTQEKVYIGNGKSTKWNGVMVTLDMDQVEKLAYSTENGRYITFLLSPRKEADQYGKTHTAAVLPRTQPKPQDTAMVAEPTGDLFETPIGDEVEVNGRKLKRITATEAAKRRAKKA